MAELRTILSVTFAVTVSIGSCSASFDSYKKVNNIEGNLTQIQTQLQEQIQAQEQTQTQMQELESSMEQHIDSRIDQKIDASLEQIQQVVINNENTLNNNSEFENSDTIKQSAKGNENIEESTESAPVSSKSGEMLDFLNEAILTNSDHYFDIIDSSVQLGSKTYTNGIKNRSFECWATYSLSSPYSYLTFELGHINHTAMNNVMVSIYLSDGSGFSNTPYTSIEVQPDADPVEHRIPLDGCTQIRFEIIPDSGQTEVALTNMMLEK